MKADYSDIEKLRAGYEQANRNLTEAVEDMKKLAKEKSEAEKQYRVLTEQAILSLKAEGQPVTLIKDIVKGRVADALFERDYKTALFDTSKAKQKALHASIESYRTLISLAKSEINMK